MKVLMINGSPHAKGNTALALEQMADVFHRDFFLVSLPEAANWATWPMLEALEACPPVLEYTSVSNTKMFTSCLEAMTWSRPP